MNADVPISALLEYTAWQRGKWLEWLREHGGSALTASAGPHGDGRFQEIGELVRHIFSAEKRYVERLSELPLTDPATIPSGDLEALFEFGRESRRRLREFIETLPTEEWDREIKLQLPGSTLMLTRRKIVTHVVLHEIRHWAQIATILRLSGLSSGMQDFLFSPAMMGADAR